MSRHAEKRGRQADGGIDDRPVIEELIEAARGGVIVGIVHGQRDHRVTVRQDGGPGAERRVVHRPSQDRVPDERGVHEAGIESAPGHERLLDVVDRIDLPAVHDEVFRQRLRELDSGKSGLGAEKDRMGPADIHRHDRSGREVYGIAVDGFAVQVDAEPLPQPGLLTVHVQQIIIAAPEPERFLQPAAGNPLVVRRSC